MTQPAQLVAGFFDPAWYAERYPDVLAAGWDPLQHYMTYGAAEERDPNRWFDSAWYRSYYVHVMKPGMTALDHYLQSGAAALRNPHPNFDAPWYVAQHPEAAANPLTWHLSVGEGRFWATEPAFPILHEPASQARGRIGIGIITCNRKDLLRQTIQRVRQYTSRTDVDFVVADDGSTDGSVAMLREQDVPVVTGVNMGVAWNKNRALYLLAQVRGCVAVILLEDDTMPDRTGWEDAWISAALRWGHVSYAGSWVAPPDSTGSGTPEDPFLDHRVTAQCASYARDALNWAGYFDTRFRGFGSEHIEHSRRLVRFGYGGCYHVVKGDEPMLFAMIRSGVAMHPAASAFDRALVDRNDALLRQIVNEEGYRAPWRDITEMKQFRAEIQSAVAARPAGFALRRPGLFQRRT